MRFQIQREAILKPLQAVVGVVEKRQTLPVLSNLLVSVTAGRVAFTGTDLQLEMVAQAGVEGGQDGEVTVPARKLFDICKALPEGAPIHVEQQGERVVVKAGRSRFVLATLPASEFPALENREAVDSLTLGQGSLKELIDRVAFAMAIQDVRFYLNGMLFDVRGDSLRAVATDGHRLAMCEAALPDREGSDRQILLPRKAVLELQRLLENVDEPVTLELGRSHLRVRRQDVVFTSNLIDGRFPDYEAVMPVGADKQVTVEREALRDALGRAAILSNEKYRGVRLEVGNGQLRVVAHNAEQEEAVEELEAQANAEGLQISFNVNYVLEALGALRGVRIALRLRDGNSSCLISDAEDDRSRHVIMPMRM
ncbi:MAG: DNA polymerase III subunit beta [Pseudoxanthomonas sp.]|nr:DNA polymerase III subunit beta [Pseudoxanthomonas sp.]